jgi:hypothetical protein
MSMRRKGVVSRFEKKKEEEAYKRMNWIQAIAIRDW